MKEKIKKYITNYAFTVGAVFNLGVAIALFPRVYPDTVSQMIWVLTCLCLDTISIKRRNYLEETRVIIKKELYKLETKIKEAKGLL